MIETLEPEKKTATIHPEASAHLKEALSHLDLQARRVGNDLEAESENLKALVANENQKTQDQISELCRSVSELDQSLARIRTHLLDALSYTNGPAVEGDESHQSDSDAFDPSISAQEAAKIRHDEPVTMMSIFRSLLMADEPGQRERRGSLD